MILYLAPLQGLTDREYRNCYATHFKGIDLAVAPFISTLQGGRCKDRELMDVLPEINRMDSVIPQIMGNNPDDFIDVANRLYDLGYKTVNWNLGCPYKMIAKKKKGSGLLCHPDLIDAFFDQVFKRMKPGLSVKMRLGRHDANEIFELMPVMNRYPLTEITIHPRTGIQMYDGAVDLETFGNALKVTTHRIIYNGDIKCLDDFRRLNDRFPRIDSWMIGRGVLSDPFLPVTIKNGCDRVPDKTTVIKRFHDDYFHERAKTLSGPAHVTDRMKAFWTFLAPSFENGDEFFRKMKKIRETELYARCVEDFFDKGAVWKGPAPSPPIGSC